MSKKKNTQEGFSFKTLNSKKVNNKKTHKFNKLKGLQLSAAKTCMYVFIAALITIGGYNILLDYGSEKAINELAKTMAHYSDKKIESFENYIDNDILNDLMYQKAISSDPSNSPEKSLRQCLLVKKDFNVIYYYVGNMLYQITDFGTKILNETNELHSFFENYDSDQHITSEWMNNSNDGNYVGIVANRFYDANGQSAVVGLGFYPTIAEKSFCTFVRAFDDLNIELLTNDNEYIYRKAHSQSFSESNLVKTNTSLSTRTDESGNKLSMMDALKNGVYKLFNSSNINGVLRPIEQHTNKLDYIIKMEISEIVSKYQVNMALWGLIILFIYITFTYLFSNNASARKVNADIISYAGIAIIFIVTFSIILQYTTSYEAMRGKQLVGDGLLIHANAVSSYDVDAVENYVINELSQKTITDESYESYESLLNKLIKGLFSKNEYNSVKVETVMHSDTCPINSYKYDSMLKELEECKGQKSYINDDKTELHIVNYHQKEKNGLKIIFKIDLAISKKLFNISETNNYRIPSIYANVDNRLYLIDSLIAETENLFLNNFEPYTGSVEYTTQGQNANVKLYDDNLNIEYYLSYKVDTTTAEAIGITIISLLNIGLIVLIILMIRNNQIDKKDEDKKDIYGDITYYSPQELEKNISLKEELNKLNNEEIAEEVVYRSRRRRTIDDEHENVDTGEEINFIHSDKNEKNELKQLGVFKTSKEIFERYTKTQIEQTEKLTPSKPVKKVEADVKFKTKRRENLTLEEANEKYRKAKVTKDELMSIRSKGEEDEFLNTSKDEDFEKNLNDKFKDTKKKG